MFNWKMRKRHNSEHNIVNNHSPTIFLILKFIHNALDSLWLPIHFRKKAYVHYVATHCLLPLPWHTSEIHPCPSGLLSSDRTSELYTTKAFQVAPSNPLLLAYMHTAASFSMHIPQYTMPKY